MIDGQLAVRPTGSHLGPVEAAVITVVIVGVLALLLRELSRRRTRRDVLSVCGLGLVCVAVLLVVWT